MKFKAGVSLFFMGGFMRGTRKNLDEAIEYLEFEGWTHLGDWLFFYEGKVYDLSAADLTQLKRIKKEGLFVVAQ
jgi:hypothetical protein